MEKQPTEYLSTLDFLSPLLLQGHVSSNGEAVADVQFLLYPQQGVKVSTVHQMQYMKISKMCVLSIDQFCLPYCESD